MESPPNPNSETEEGGPQEPEDGNLAGPAGECGDMLLTVENVCKHAFIITLLNFDCLDVVYYQTNDEEPAGRSNRRKLVIMTMMMNEE